MKLDFRKIAIPAISALLGATFVLILVALSPSLQAMLASSPRKKLGSPSLIFDDIMSKQRGIQENFDSLFDDQFFGGSDPFREMQRMREEMLSRMEGFESPNSANNPFDLWFAGKFGGGSVYDISQREDENFIYYDIKVNDLQSTSINTRIENGQITITGTIQRGGDESSAGLFKSTFNRSFPLPPNVDHEKMELLPEADKMVLKFPKLKE